MTRLRFQTILCATMLSLATFCGSSLSRAGCPTTGGGSCATTVRPVYRPSVPTQARTPATDVRSFVAAAKRDFAAARYAQALGNVDKALAALPRDADLHQFRSLCLFAQGQYKPAAASAYAAFTLGNAWTWGTLRSFYNGSAQYTAQYHRLARAAKDAPQSADMHFLLAYHHLMLDHREAGRQELQKALELLPGDQVITALLKVLGETTAASGASSVEVSVSGR